MANEKEQGRQNAEFNSETTYLLMLSGAIEDAGVLLENYLEAHPMDAEVAPVVLAYALHTVEVTKFLRSEDYQPGKINMTKAREKRELLFSALNALSEDQRDAFYKTYLPEVVCALFLEKDANGEEICSFLRIFGKGAKEIATPAFLSSAEAVARVLLPFFEKEEVYDFTMSVMDAVCRMDKALYGKLALSFGRVAIERGDFAVAKAMLENATPFLDSLAESRFLELCAALKVRNEEEFLGAEGFSKQMPEYMNLLVAIAGDDVLTRHYTELAEKNLSGEYKKKTSASPSIKKNAIIAGVVVAICIFAALLFPGLSGYDSATSGPYKKYSEGWGLSGNIAEEEIIDGVFYVPEEIRGIPVISLESYTLGSGSLTTVYIPKTVKNINDGAFAGAINLQQIIVDPENPYYTDIDGVLYSKDGKELIAYPAGKNVTSFTVPDGVEVVRSRAFDSAYSLLELTFPSSVKMVEAAAFKGVRSLIVYCNGDIEWDDDWKWGANVEVIGDDTLGENDKFGEEYDPIEIPIIPFE